MFNTFTPVRIWLNLTVVEIYAKICCLTSVLFLVTAAVFFKRSKIQTVILCRILQGTLRISFMQIYAVVSEEKMFEEIVNDDDDDVRQSMAIGQVS